MNSLVVGTFVVLLGLASCEVTYEQLAGVWTTGDTDSGCRTDIQFLYKNYVSYNTGEDCGAIGAFLGTYALADDVVFVQFCSAPKNFGLTFISYGITVESNTLKLYALDENQENGNLVITATKVAAKSFDGIWSGTVTGSSATVRTQFEAGLYLSYTILNEDLSGTIPYYGRIGPSEFDADNYAIYFADFQDGSFDGSAVSSDGYVFENVSVLLDGNSLSVSSDSSSNAFAVTYARRAEDQFEGIWTGFNDPCYTTVQFTTGLFRSYNIGGASCTNQAFLGVYNVLNDLTIRVGYARSTISSFEGQAITISYTFSEDGETLDLTGPVPGTDGTFSLSLTKVTSPPLALLTRLHLEGSPSDFDSDSFIEELSTLTELPTSQFEEISIQNGSVIFNFAMIDDQAAEILASDGFKTLASQTSIGGFNVLDISALAGNLDETTTAVPSDDAAFSSFQFSFASLIVLIFAIIFA